MKQNPVLYVEGNDDLWTIQALLEVNGIKLIKDSGPVNIKTVDSASEMLDGLETFIKAAQSARMPVGFVLDIDLDIESRWRSICSRLSNAGFLVSSDMLNENGIIFDLPEGKVGIWLMPDNTSHNGKLEDFLRTLIKSDDCTLSKAKAYVEDIRCLFSSSERYRDIDIEKAELSAWLAVKNPPGLPYGTAIKARIMQPTSPVAEKFVTWFSTLFSIERNYL